MRPELTRKAFERWEEIIAQAVQLYPSPLLFYPRPTDPNTSTCISRLRDAILSFSRYGWSPTHIDTVKFAKIGKDLAVGEDGGRIRLGPRLKFEAPTVRPVLSTTPVTLATTLTAEQRGKVLHALCLLREYEVLPTIEITPVTDEQHKELALITATYNVACIYANNTATLL